MDVKFKTRTKGRTLPKRGMRTAGSPSTIRKIATSRSQMMPLKTPVSSSYQTMINKYIPDDGKEGVDHIEVYGFDSLEDNAEDAEYNLE
jgi:hypothetical protein